MTKNPSMKAELENTLIEEVAHRRYLYDSSHPSYRIQAKKIEAWRDIAKKLGCDGKYF